MNSTKNISRTQGICLGVNLLCNKLFLLTPAFFIGNAGSGALFSVLTVYAIAFLFFSLFFKKTDGDLFALMKKMWFQRTFHFLSFLLTLFCCVVNFSLLIYFLKATVFPKSPYLFLALPFALCMGVCAKNGMKSVAGTAGFFVPFLFTIPLLLLATTVKNFDLTQLFPLFGKGVKAIFLNGVFMLSSLFEVLVLFYLPAFYPKQKLAGIVRPTLAISCLLYLLIIGSVLLLGNSHTAGHAFSLLQTGFSGRNDGIFLLIYTLSGMLYLASMLFFSAEMFQKAFPLPTKNVLFLPLTLLIVLYSEITFLNQEGQAFLKNAGLMLWLMPFSVPFLFLLFAKNKKELKHD